MALGEERNTSTNIKNFSENRFNFLDLVTNCNKRVIKRFLKMVKSFITRAATP